MSGLKTATKPKTPDWLKCPDCGTTDPKQFYYQALATEVRSISIDAEGRVHLSEVDVYDEQIPHERALVCRECPSGCILLPEDGDDPHPLWANVKWD